MKRRIPADVVGEQEGQEEDAVVSAESGREGSCDASSVREGLRRMRSGSRVHGRREMRGTDVSPRMPRKCSVK